MQEQCKAYTEPEQSCVNITRPMGRAERLKQIRTRLTQDLAAIDRAITVLEQNPALEDIFSTVARFY
jgi:hypothetical protein